jgi:hypothetical protein
LVYSLKTVPLKTLVPPPHIPPSLRCDVECPAARLLKIFKRLRVRCRPLTQEQAAKYPSTATMCHGRFGVTIPIGDCLPYLELKFKEMIGKDPESIEAAVSLTTVSLSTVNLLKGLPAQIEFVGLSAVEKAEA